jgi:hypothetical protein
MSRCRLSHFAVGVKSQFSRFRIRSGDLIDQDPKALIHKNCVATDSCGRNFTSAVGHTSERFIAGALKWPQQLALLTQNLTLAGLGVRRVFLFPASRSD